MAINFPDNRDQLVPPQPSGPIQTGDVYVYLGTTYTATVLSDSSVRWDAAVSAGSDAYVLKVGDTMTGQLTLPGGGTGNEAATVSQIPVVPAALWQRDGGTSTLSPATADDNLNQGSGSITTTGNLGAAAGTFTGDVSAANFTTTGNVQTTSLNSGPLAGFRNYLANGSMAIAQRGTDVTPSGSNPAGYLTADRWAHTGSGDNVGRIVRDTAAATIGSPPGFDYTLHFVDASKTNRGGFVQMIELPLAGHPGPFVPNSQWTLSFWINIDLSGLTGAESLSFADDSNGTNTVVCAPGTGLTYTEIDTAPDNWRRYSITYTLDNSAPAGTNTGFRVNLGLPTRSGKLAITGIQFEPGPVASTWEARPIQTELALCQRYYQVIHGYQNSTGLNMGAARNGARTRSTHTYGGQIIALQFEYDLVTTLRAHPTTTIHNHYVHVSGQNGNDSANWDTRNPYLITDNENQLNVMYSATAGESALDFYQIRIDAEL